MLHPFPAVAAAAILAAAVSVALAAAPSPYAGEETRSIKALSEAEVAGLLAGDGLGFAKAAELNGHPGPRHVLDLAAELALEPAQLAEVEESFRSMNGEARRLGAEIVARERALDRLFAEARAEAGAVERLTAEIALLEGRLRARHLKAHLEIRPLLSRHQLARYDALRGYAAPGHGGGHGGH